MPALFRPQMVLVVLSAALLLAASALTGCAKSDRPACNVTADCEDEGNVCEDGFCEAIAGSCVVHEDCENDYLCVAETCVPPSGDDEGDGDNGEGDNGEGDNGEGDNGEGDNGEGDNGEGDNGEGDEEEINPGSPIIESVTPADGATDLGLDVVVRITFDRPIAHEFGALSDEGVFLRNPNGSKVAADLEYLEDEREVVLTPNQPLLEGHRYTIYVTELIRDESGNNYLQHPHQSVFTTAYELNEDLVALAELFAPTVYQETRLTDVPEIYSDIPTRVDFDGDFDANNNKANSMQSGANPPAHVYYSVVSSETHHFIHYILYYPTRRLGSGGATSYNEHSFTGIVMAVNRDDWSVELVEGVHTALSSANDSTHTFRPTSSAVEGRGTHENNIIDFDPDFLDGGAGFPLYVSSGDHASCFWHERDSSFWPSACHDQAEEFLGGQGLILTRGDVGQTIEDAVDGEEAGHREMTYELIPFVEPFWTQRGDFDCGLFSINQPLLYSPYSPDGHTPPDGPDDDGLYLHRSLCSDDTDSYGNLPFRWFSADSGSNGGEWFLDPAVALSTRFDFGDDFSLDYCDNFYFNIDRNEDAACGGEE